MNSLQITDVSVWMTDGTILTHQTVQITDGAISSIRAFSPEDVHTAIPYLSGKDKLMMPGLADCHTHTGQQLLKGRILDELPMIWTRIMLPFESTLTEETVSLSASLASLEMIRSGTTAFMDAGSYHMDAAAEIYLTSGLRGILSLSTMDEEGLPDSIATDTEEAIKRADLFYDTWNEKGLLRASYELRSLLSCSEKLILGISDHAKERGTLLQAHMSEYPNEVNYFLKNKQMRPAEYLDFLGVLDSHFVSAHSILLSEQEADLFAKNKVKVCHCPFSNCGKGVPNTPALLQKGVLVGLGTDGAAHGGLSLWNEMKIFRSVMNVTYGVPQSNPAIMPAKTIIQMAAANGYQIMGEAEAGSIKKGNKADFILIDLNAPHLCPSGNLTNTLLESVVSSDVSDMVVNGKILMKDREVLTLDEEKILYEGKKYLERL